LVHEVTQQASADGWLVLKSGALSFGKATSYLPIVDIVRRACRVEPPDDAATIRQRVAEQVLGLGAGLEAILPPLLALLDAPADDAA
jgi:hypothetical protein